MSLISNINKIFFNFFILIFKEIFIQNNPSNVNSNKIAIRKKCNKQNVKI